MTLHKTPLHAWHLQRGAKMAPFAGWDMPIQYQGIIAEHKQTREHAALFDICHMGEFLCHGPDAKDALARALSHNLETLAPGRCRYGFLLNEQGGIIDDMIVYRLEPEREDDERFMIVVNGARTDIDRETIAARLPAGVILDDISPCTAKIDLQGPESLDVLQRVLQRDLTQMKYFSFIHCDFQDAPVLVSRTGYTGELGFELYLDSQQALALWEACLADERVLPAGLGARDTLRLEMGLPLYGQDLDEQHTPAEAGYEAMLTSPAEYVGKGHDRNVREKLVPLALEGRRAARHDDLVFSTDGLQAGRVTSGSFAPSVGQSVALAYIQADVADADTFVIRTGRNELTASRAELPFYKNGTARKKLTAS